MTAAAVWFPTLDIPDGVDDSKKIAEKRRPDIAMAIRSVAIVAIGHSTVDEIEAHGIRWATLNAMARAWRMLGAPSDALVIIDGDDIPEAIHAQAVAMKAADASCPSVAAASVIAKVDRDQAMRVLAGADDPYGWKQNKGYGTKAHMDAIALHGPGPWHRKGFEPIRSMIRNGGRP